MQTQSTHPVCEIKNIDKRFFDSRVLTDVSFDVRPGDVVGLAGENGAGKSTLMKTIGGTHLPDGGEICIGGKCIPYGNPLAVQRMGVSVIYQEFSLIPQLSVAENLQMRHSASRNQLSFVRWKEMYKKSEALLAQLGSESIDPRTLVQDLSVANKQLVEIAKALTIDAKLLLMDEPSATLNAKETENMFRIIRTLQSQGVGIIYITHRLEEIFEVCNRLVVLKDGVVTNDGGLEGLEKSDIISMMVGRDVGNFFDTHEKKIEHTAPVLEVENLRSDAGVHDVSFKLYPGETLGIAGLNGAGRSEMVRAICGLDGAKAEKRVVNGKNVTLRSVRDAMKHGIAYLPEERKTQGMVPTMTVKENMSYAAIKSFSKGLFVNAKRESAACDKLIGDLKVKCSGPDQLIRNLSGGNQQKVIIGKWMLNEPQIYLMDEPTRGIDVGAKHEIYELINKLTEQGAAVIFVSSELPELLGVSDRILVMAGGTITGEMDRSEASEERIMNHAFVAEEKEEVTA